MAEIRAFIIDKRGAKPCNRSLPSKIVFQPLHPGGKSEERAQWKMTFKSTHKQKKAMKLLICITMALKLKQSKSKV